MLAFAGNKFYKQINLTDKSLQEEVESLISQKTRARRFNMREALNRARKEHGLTRCMRDIYEFIFQISEQRKFKAIELPQRWIGDRASYCRQTVNGALKKLEELGLLLIHRRENGYPHQYQITIPDWLKKFISYIPGFNKKKHLFSGGVSGSMTQSNEDMSSYRDYTEFKNSKDERMRQFRLRHPDKAKELDKKYTEPSIWRQAFESYKPKDIINASKETVERSLSQLKSLFGR